MVFEGGAFKRWLGYEGRSLMNETSAHLKETPERLLTPSTVWGHNKKMDAYELGKGFSAGALVMITASRDDNNQIWLFISYLAYSNLLEQCKWAETVRDLTPLIFWFP